MTKKWLAIFPVILLLQSGCATFVMRSDFLGNQPKGLYPATRADVGGSVRYCRNQLDPAGGWRGAGSPHHPNLFEKTLWVTFSTVDLPISLVTDTMCFPWDLKRKMDTRRHAQAFLDRVDRLQSDGDEFTESAIQSISNDLPTLLSLTPEDIHAWSRRRQLEEGDDDLYPILMLMAGLCQNTSTFDYVVAHFGQIRHPELKTIWAVSLFEKGNRSAEVVSHLKKIIHAENQRGNLKEFLGSDWEDFKKRVMSETGEDRRPSVLPP
jgi:uncharacterized protein YceK